MSGSLDARVAIVTGAGGGIGRGEALYFAAEGAKVVVNDVGGDVHGSNIGPGAAQNVVDEIRAAGGEAVANTDDVATWSGARRLVETAINVFGGLHVLVNNAGILRDRVLVRMSEAEWDAVNAVHMKGHFCPTRHAAAYWRDQAKSGHKVDASIIHTSSTSGLLGNPGQANYGAAKAGIAGFSANCALELDRYGVRSNAITPAARTRMTLGLGLHPHFDEPDRATQFDDFHPDHIAPMVGYLATAGCTINGEVFYVAGDVVARYEPFTIRAVERNHKSRWTYDRLQHAVERLLTEPRGGGPDEFDKVLPSGTDRSR